MKLNYLIRIMEMVDIIEIFVSRNILHADNKKGYEFAKDNEKLMLVGSDAHMGYEYGEAYIKTPLFNDAQEFKKQLSYAEFITRKSPFWVHPATKWIKVKTMTDKLVIQ